MPASLAGVFAVEESAGLLRHYRYAAERMMRILGGWIALTPELSAKLLLGRQVWECAQQADALGRRLLELRAPAQVSEPSGPGFVAFMDELERPEAPHQTVERLVGVYRVLKPHLLATYEWHLARTNPVYEPPTRRILSSLRGGRAAAHLGGGDDPASPDREPGARGARRGLARAARGAPGGGGRRDGPRAPPGIGVHAGARTPRPRSSSGSSSRRGRAVFPTACSGPSTT